MIFPVQLIRYPSHFLLFTTEKEHRARWKLIYLRRVFPAFISILFSAKIIFYHFSHAWDKCLRRFFLYLMWGGRKKLVNRFSNVSRRMFARECDEKSHWTWVFTYCHRCRSDCLPLCYQHFNYFFFSFLWFTTWIYADAIFTSLSLVFFALFYLFSLNHWKLLRRFL